MISTEASIADAYIDISGFHRRIPTGMFAYLLQQLRPGELLQIRAAKAFEVEHLCRLLHGLGMERVAISEVDGYRLLRVRKARWRAAHELDLRGARCPVPVIEARRRVRHLQSDEVLRLVTDCTAAPQEIGSWVANDPTVTLHGIQKEGERADVFYLGQQ